MLNFALAIARKDLRLLFARGCGLIQAILLGLLLIFVFSISRGAGEISTSVEAAAIFWLSSVFCQILLFTRLYAVEEENLSRHGLLLAAAPVQAIWLGKALAAFPLLCLAQTVFLPAATVFLGQNISGPILPGVYALCAVDVGICALGSLLGAAGQGGGGRESLFSIIIFPLLVPILLGGISLGGLAFGSEAAVSPAEWLGLICAFDAVFIGAGLLLFGFLYQGEE